MITIKKIYVEDFLSRDKTQEGARLVCELDTDGTKEVLFLECEKKWKEYLVTERADAFVFFLLPIATREGHDIVSYIPITEELKNNLEKTYIPLLTSEDKKIYHTRIFADTVKGSFDGWAVGTANSLGVDSFYTIYKYGESQDPDLRLTHFYMGAVSLDLWNSHARDLFGYLKRKKYHHERYKLVAKELGKELIMTYSNLIKYMCVKYGYIHVTVDTFITMAEVMCFKKLWKTYMFSSGLTEKEYSIGNTRKTACAHYDLSTLKAISVPGFTALSAGVEATRHQKTVAIADFEPAQKYLRPCFNILSRKKEMKNCGRSICPKCLRLLISADVSDNLEKFKNVIDIEKYKKHRKRYLKYVVWGNRRKSHFMPELYPYCVEKYPKEMKSLEKLFDFLFFKWFKSKKK